MDQPDATALQPLQKDIVEAVVETWNSGKTVLPLARLGQILIGRGYDLRLQLGGKKLAEMVRTDLAAYVQVLRHPTNTMLTAAAPADAQLEGDIEKYFVAPPAAAPVDQPKVPRFNKVVWAAFVRALPDGFVRTLALEPRPQFQDVSAEAASASGKYRIEQTDTVPYGSASPSSEVVQKVNVSITNWAAKNGVSIQSLHEEQRSDSSIPTSGRVHGSLLDRLVSALSDDELKSVKLSLNVVRKLMNS